MWGEESLCRVAFRFLRSCCAVKSGRYAQPPVARVVHWLSDKTSMKVESGGTNAHLSVDGMELSQPPGSDHTGAAPDQKLEELTQSRQNLQGWLNRFMRIKMTDGRILVGAFVCTDRDRNIILGSCDEYVNSPDVNEKEEPRVLGLAMVPGQHIVSIEIDDVER